ncbi:MAG: hypothetical protein WCE80_03475 [Acidimicrobiia bacterium]
MTPPPAQGRARLRWALPVLLVLASACSPSSGSGESTTITVPTTSTTTPVETTTAAPSTTTTIDAAAVLGMSLESTSPNYRFESVFEAGGQALTTITGVVDGTSVAAHISTGSSQVSYVHTDAGEWITDADGTWIVLEGDPPVAPPLTALADPSSLVVQSGDTDSGVVKGVLGPAAGSAAGLGFTVELVEGLVTKIVYEADIGGETAMVTTSISDVGKAGEVSPPDLG